MARNVLLGMSSRVLMLIVAGLLILSYLTVVVNPAEAWYVTILGLMFVPLSFLNFVLVLWALKRRSKAVLIPLMAFLPAMLFLGRYVQVGKEESLETENPSLKLISYNVGNFNLFDKDSGISDRDECADSIFSFLLEQNPDIICLQEFHIDDIDKVKPYLRKHFKSYKAEYLINHQNGRGSGNVTLSRFPVKGKGAIKFDESSNLALYTDYEVDRRKFRV